MKKYLMLGSRIALGVYVPAISLKRQLERYDILSDVLCLEDLYTGRDAVMEETKKSLHKDFRLAKLSYRLPTRNKSAIDPESEMKLIRKLSEAPYEKIIVFSGFWLEFLNKLMNSCPYYKGKIYAIHMDADYSLSWKGGDRIGIQEIWLYNLERSCIEHLLEDEPKPDMEKKRNGRILVHGGGWGIGEYNDKIKCLNDLGYGLDIILYYADELPSYAVNQSDEEIRSDIKVYNRYFLLDPTWKPDEDRNEYPRILKYESGKWVLFGDNTGDVNPLRLLMNQSLAVLSKPGGGTLSDSFITGTPLIFGDELAAYESANKQLWIDLGFGVEYDKLVEGCSEYENSGEINKGCAYNKKLLDDMRGSICRARQGVPHVLDEILDGNQKNCFQK